MRHPYLFCSILLATAAASLLAQDEPAANRKAPPRAGLTLTSPAFSDGGVIPAMPKSPPLEWKGVLPNTVSFVLIVHDANTSLGGSADDVLHWMVFNIPASARELAAGLPIAGELPDGSIQGVNRGGQNGYRPVGGGGGGGTGAAHHFIFDFYALDAKLPLGAKATRAEVVSAMAGHVLEKGALVGRSQ